MMVRNGKEGKQQKSDISLEDRKGRQNLVNRNVLKRCVSKIGEQ